MVLCLMMLNKYTFFCDGKILYIYIYKINIIFSYQQKKMKYFKSVSTFIHLENLALNSTKLKLYPHKQQNT